MMDLIVFSGGSIVIFLGWMWAQNKTAWFALNPLVLSLASIISILLLLEIPYSRYMQGAKFIDYLMEPAVVALGYPLYKQLAMIGKVWRELLAVCFSGVMIVLTLSCLACKALGLEEWLIYSIVTMNITTAISMETSEVLGGEPALAACMVMIAGFTGCTLGIKALHLTRLNEPKCLGVAIGLVSHALGTAMVARESYEGSAYASTALIICAIFTAIIAPIYIPFLVAL